MKIGDIVYYVLPHDPRNIHWGIIEEEYLDGYGLHLYELPDTRRVCGTPIAQFPFGFKRKKLPKGWSWDTDLCQVTEDAIPTGLRDVHINNPGELLDAIKQGWLVSPDTQQSAAVVDADINKDGYTILLKYPRDTKIPMPHALVQRQYCFSTYTEAKRVVDNYEAELQRQAALSDRDWSLEHIEHDIERLATYKHLTNEEARDIEDWFLAQPNIEDLETRFFAGNLQFKYTKNKTWRTYEI